MSAVDVTASSMPTPTAFLHVPAPGPSPIATSAQPRLIHHHHHHHRKCRSTLHGGTSKMLPPACFKEDLCPRPTASLQAPGPKSQPLESKIHEKQQEIPPFAANHTSHHSGKEAIFLLHVLHLPTDEKISSTAIQSPNAS